MDKFLKEETHGYAGNRNPRVTVTAKTPILSMGQANGLCIMKP